MKMEWIDWIALGFAVWCAADLVVARIRCRRAEREFKAWMEQMRLKHGGKRS